MEDDAGQPGGTGPPGADNEEWIEARRAVALGDLSSASVHLSRCVAARGQALGRGHPWTLSALIAYAQVAVLLGRPALVPLIDAARGGFEHVMSLRGASETRRVEESAYLAVATGKLVELAARSGDAEATRHAAEALVNGKCAGLALATLLHPARDSVTAPETRAHLAARLAALTVRGLDGTVAEFLAAFSSADAAYRGTQNPGALPAQAASHWVSIDDIARCLPTRAAYVDLGLYLATEDRVFPDDISDVATPRYAGVVITSSGLVRWRELGNADSFEPFVAEYLSQADMAVSLSHVPQLQAALAAAAAQTGRQLWERTLGALELPADLDALQTCVDGVLAGLPLECALMPDGRYAIERFAFLRRLAANQLTQEAAAGWRRRQGPGLDALLVAAPTYDDEPGPTAPTTHTTRPPRARFPICTELGRQRWRPLEGTRREIGVIEAHFAAASRRTLIGRDATKSAVREAQGPRVLHLATHAYYLGESVIVSRESEAGPVPVLTAPYDLRCGVVLSGANSRRGLDPRFPDDGVLTARELAEIDLRGTELVVLSACETARGGARMWDTVNGLALACHLAGARTVVASRWRVPDQASADLFDDFYGRLAGSDPPTALRTAILAAIAGGRSGSRPAFALPHAWAAWTVSTAAGI